MIKFFDSLFGMWLCWLLAIFGVSFSFTNILILMTIGFILWGVSALLMFIGIIIEANKNNH